MNSYQWNTRDKKKNTSLHENIDAVTSLAAQVKVLSKKLDTLTSPRMAAVINCESCGGGHNPVDCLISIDISTSIEQVDYVGNAMRGQGNPYSSTFNQGQRNHLKFSWSNQRQQKPVALLGFQQPQWSILENRVSKLEKILAKFIQSSDTRFQNV